MTVHQKLCVLFAIGACFPLMCPAEDPAPLLRTNSDWHMTSDSFPDAPFWLAPSNAPVRFFPLKNGRWIWTTNMQARLDNSVIDTHRIAFDSDKEYEVEQEERRRMFASAFPGLAHVAEYGSGHAWSTNESENWWGMWAEDTNTGWRVNLCPVRSNDVDEAVIIKVGSVLTNSGAGLLPSPDGKYAKLELIDSNGSAIPRRSGSATKLYEEKYAVTAGTEKEMVNRRPPSEDDTTVEEQYPETISDLEYPRWNVEGSAYRQRGSFIQFAGFASNGPPCHIGFIRFNDIFSIKAAGDYTLMVRPVLYRMHCDGGTFQGYLDRVDLPCVTTKVHLVPNLK